MSTTPNSMDEGNAPKEPPQQSDPNDPSADTDAQTHLDAVAAALAAESEPADEAETTPESTESTESTEPAQPSPAKKTPTPLATELQARIDELNGQLLRALAEVDNVRKRSDRMIADTHKYAVANFAKDLLSVPDNLNRAMDAVPEEARTGDGLVAKLLEGVSAVDRELASAFEKHGLTKLEPMDVPFDPNFHEAVFQVPNSGKPAGTVVQLLQTGYTLHGRLVRAAMVGVAKGDGSPPEHKVDTTA